MNWKNKEYVLSDDSESVDFDRTYRLLAGTYWAERRPREVVEKVIRNSICFSLLRGDEQIGFARVVSDFATTSWVADMVIDEAHRGSRLGTWIMECILSHEKFKGTQFILQTKDAHRFYEKLGFSRSPALMSTSVSYL